MMNAKQSRALFFVFGVFLLTSVSGVLGDTYPPDWNGGGDPPVHFAPVPWPADDGDGLLDYGDWVPYTIFNSGIEDNGTQDPSNGGTAPQNYVNVSSGCTDLSLPSVFVYYDSANQVLMFRWRVEQIANTYATGPTIGPASAVDPWKSALWTVLIDVDGDGFRDYAVQVDGSSGQPGTQVDQMKVIYSDSLDQSLDYTDPDRPDICEVAHNPTAFTDDFSPAPGPTGNILNFRNNVNPTWIWGNGSNETLWDYGTTRARELDQGVCIEYFVDYQIPLAALDASGTGDPDCTGPAVTENTPICLLFTTSNSLENPLQKDVVMEPPTNPGDTCILDPEEEAPFGDCFLPGDFDPDTGDLGTIDQPTVQDVTAAGCNPATLTATVSDTLDGTDCYTGTTVGSSIQSVRFYYYYDEDGNGLDDDGNVWTAGPVASPVAGSLGEWEATGWDTTGLRQGNFLIGVRAEDDQGNVTWSYLTQAEVDATFPGDNANPSPIPGELFSNFLNVCGTYPSVTKSASVSEVAVGGTVDFTITVTAATDQALLLGRLDDFLPAGWTFSSLEGGTLTPDSPAPAETPTGSGTTLTWTFTPATSIAAGTSRTLVFRATAPAVEGSYQNQAQAMSSNEGTLTSNKVQVGVGAPVLSLTKTPDAYSATPGATVTYTVTYGNDSPVTVTNAVLTDVVPTGLTFVSATGGGTYDAGTRTVTWTVGTLASGSTGNTVSFTATVDDPYPSGGANPLVNTVELDSDDTTPITADAPVFVSLPLRVQKTSSVPSVATGGSVTFTISYENTSTQTAVNAVLRDLVPTGFNFVSATGGGTYNAGTRTVTWSLGNLPGAPGPGNSGSVQVTLQASSPYTSANPAVNTALFSSDNFSEVSDTYSIPVTGVTCTAPTTFYMKSTSQEIDSTHAGAERLANTTAPVGTASTTGLITVGPGVANIQELIRFYQDPPYAEQRSFSQDVTTTLYLAKSGSPQARFRLTLYDFDPATETAVSLGFNEQTVTGGPTNAAVTFTIPRPTVTIATGHRLLWVLRAYSNHGSQSVQVGFNYDGAASPSASNVCTDILQTVINKTVDKLSVTSTPAPLQTLSYTITFTNPTSGIITGAAVVDVLPAGVTYDATFTPLLNGVGTAAPSISGRTLTFSPVNGAGNAAGAISSGNSGTLLFRVTVDSPPTATSSTLLNTATLQTNEAEDVSDTAVTNLLRPNIVVVKSASPTLILPGGTTTFTVTITNAGTATATGVTMTDTLPVQPYFQYVACTVDTSAAPSTTTTGCSFASPTLLATADVLAAGETLVVTFSMQATTIPAPPAGFTTETNAFARVTHTTEPGVNADSGPASVTISTSPNLTIDLTADKSVVGTSEVVTYTIVVTNVGYADALDVLVTNPIPGLTDFVSGSLTYEGGSRTDANDGDNATYNLIGDQLEWDLGTLPPGGTRTMTFQVVTDPTLPAGSTSIVDTATVDSSNAATKDDTVTITANAAPVLTVTKSAPATMAMPLTTLSGNHNNTTTVNVNDASLLSVNDWIFVQGDAGTQILAITGNQLTVSVPVTGNNGSQVEPVIPYVIRYRNTGDADATNVEISDTLPDPGGTPISELVYADNGGTGDGGSPETVTWSLGTVAAGATGTVRMWVHPTEAGTYTNTATLSSDQTAPVSDGATTEIGVLSITKATSTPSVTSDTTDPKTVASYTVTVTAAVTANGVEITDVMEPGFTLCDAGSTDAACLNPLLTPPPTTPVTAPVDGDNTLVWCCWDLAANGTVTISYDARLGFEVGSGTYQNDVQITSANPSLDFDFLATAAEDVTVTFVGPNYVLLTDVSAALGEDGVELRWTTDAELGTAGFRVLRLDPGQGYVQVRDGVLPAAMSPQGASYRLTDPDAPAAAPLAYVLQEVLANGAHRTYGPFLVDPFARSTDERLDGGFAGTPRTKAKPAASPASGGLPGQDRGPGTGLRIGVREEGLYRVAAETIDAALGLRDGEASSLLRSGKLRLLTSSPSSPQGALSSDVEVPWMAEGGGEATGLLFYGQGIRSRYSNERVYRLLPERGERMKNASGGVQGDVSPTATFRDTVRAEEDVRPALVGDYGDDVEFWVWSFLVGGGGAFGSQSFTLDAPGAVTTAGGTAELTVALLGASVTGTGAHHVEAYVNGVAVGDGRLRNYESAELVFDFPASVLLPGANTVELVALLDPGVGYSLVALDHFRLAYDRDYAASSPAFAFGSEEHEQIVVDGFGDPEILLLDVSDPTDPREVRGAEVEPGNLGAYQLRFSPDTANGRYLAAVAAGVREPSSIEVDHPSSLHDASNRADYLVITATELVTSAEALAAHRASQSLTTMVVDVDDVMDEWNGGQLDPAAIRAFLAYAAANWAGPPRYVALVGEGTVDYKDAWGLGTNLLPPLLAGSGWGLYASDNRLADFDDDGTPELAVGRVTVTSAAELDDFVAKIVAFETAADATWMSDVVLLADDPDATGQYTLASEAYAGLLPAGAVAHRIYLGPTSPADASAELLGWLGSGTSLVSFLGHAGLTQLTHERILTSAHVPALSNGERLPVVSAMACNLGNFSLPGFPSLAEDLVLHPGGGAAAVWTAVGLSYNPQRVVLGEAFLTAVSQGGFPRLGDAVLYALRVGAAHPAVSRETLETQVLLGDPALRLRIAPAP